VLLAGCKRSDLVEVTGEVTWEGKPLPTGEIVFFSPEKSIPPHAGRIVNGSFRFMSKPGTARVDIQAARLTGKRDPIEGFEISELYIPAKYNKDSQLKVEVTPDGTNHFKFDLTK
jgi:hypothetical protein